MKTGKDSYQKLEIKYALKYLIQYSFCNILQTENQNLISADTGRNWPFYEFVNTQHLNIFYPCMEATSTKPVFYGAHVNKQNELTFTVKFPDQQCYTMVPARRKKGILPLLKDTQIVNNRCRNTSADGKGCTARFLAAWKNDIRILENFTDIDAILDMGMWKHIEIKILIVSKPGPRYFTGPGLVSVLYFLFWPVQSHYFSFRSGPHFLFLRFPVYFSRLLKFNTYHTPWLKGLVLSLG